jgi:sulfonate transport system substrate-binding protein
MQCAKLFGPANFGKLDHLTVSMAHPDALAALLSGSRGSITAHFGQSPFQEEELKDFRVNTVLTSQDVLGGPASSELLASTAAFRDSNPVLYKAVIAALEEAISTINSDKSKAAQIYVAKAQSKDDPKAIEKIISAPQVAYSFVPNGIMKYAEFMYQIGRTKRRQEKWSDLFFPEIHDRPGS